MPFTKIKTIDGAYLKDGPLRYNNFQTTFASTFVEMEWTAPVNGCLLETPQYQTHAKIS